MVWILNPQNNFIEKSPDGRAHSPDLRTNFTIDAMDCVTDFEFDC